MWGIDGLSRKVDKLLLAQGELGKSVASLQGATAHLRTEVEGILQQMAMNQQDLDRSLDAMSAGLDSGIAEIMAAVNDLRSKIGPGVDLSAEVNRITAATQRIQQVAADVQSADQNPQPTPTPTPTPEPPVNA